MAPPIGSTGEGAPRTGGFQPPSGNAARQGAELARDPWEQKFFDPFAEIAVTKNRLPHWQQPGATYFVTWHLADSLPRALWKELDLVRGAWLRAHPRPWTAKTELEYHKRFSAKIDKWLDQGYGSCLLSSADAHRVVADTLTFFDGDRYQLFAWVVMPNHVHAVFALAEGVKLEALLHSWKRHSASLLNRLHRRAGTLWQRDSFDRIVRDSSHFARCIRYVRLNPHNAKLRAGEYMHYEDEAFSDLF
jgi:REP element-mobilizing transposase RayT